MPGLGLGGAETLLFELVSRKSEFAHSVVCLGGRGWFSEKLEALGVRVEHLDVRGYSGAARGLVRLAGLIGRLQPDIIQSWLYSANLMAGIAAKTARIPVVWGIHSCWSNRYPIATRLLASAGGILAPLLPAEVINCSKAAAQTHGKLGYSGGPRTVIHNGYDPARFAPDPEARAAARREIGISPETFLIGSITRWIDYKDIPTLLRALRLVVDHGSPFTCILLGQGLGPQNKALADAIYEAGCTPYVLPLGRRSDIPRLAAAMDLHVLPSLTEAFPNVVAETMLSGVPNVTTDVGDSSLMVGDTGWVVAPADAGKLANAIREARQEWSEDPRSWEKRRTAARARIVDNFSFDRMADAYGEVWGGVAGQHPPGDRATARR